MLWTLPEIPLREERESFDRILKGSEWRKPQCQVYAPLGSACSMKQLFCYIARIIACQIETRALGSATYKNHKLDQAT